MKKFVVLLFFLCSVNLLSAQKLNNLYVQRPHEEGILYFIRPQDMSRVDKTEGKYPLSYDFTYLNSRDSLSFLATCQTYNTFIADSMSVILSSGKKHTYPVNRLYSDKMPKYWNNRIQCNIEYVFWEEMYNDNNAFTITVFSSSQKISFKDTPANWQKRRNIILTIQDIIKLNRK